MIKKYPQKDCFLVFRIDIRFLGLGHLKYSRNAINSPAFAKKGAGLLEGEGDLTAYALLSRE